ncbi:HlyD family efflux transporter periplasmic adaptor subunit [Spirosoma sp. HMF4905]|uniref:HlyD family efflux transporter periplasmic adaptor subunit n=1 Tax=Spirosoma arboris TaxID=2682092 RepID=A0A7K1SB50_9BACT|nr:HlyD family efflux transporter periplasmic adaptor subunit [Spirosoma arboris]MVM30898.1 HlyD family efflux transporter periplasmic adaptor subunit [Spirosoma arboris]
MNALLAELDEKQYEDLYHVDDAPLADVRQRVLSRLAWWSVVLVIIGAGMGLTIRFPDMIQVPFVVKSEVAEAMYRFPSTMYVEQTFVKVGQHVEAGTPLLEVSAPDVAALVDEFSIAGTKLAQYQQFKTASTGNERQMLALSSVQLQEDIRLKEMQLDVLQTKWTSESVKLQYEQQEAQRLFKVNQGFYRDGDISRNDLNGFEAAQLRAQYAYQTAAQNFRQDERALRQQIKSNRLEISSISQKSTKTGTDFQAEGALLRSSLEAIRKRIQGRFGAFAVTSDNHLILKAERTGTVSFVFNGEKEAAPGATVLKMIYKQAPFYASTQVNSSRIGQVKTGQAVVLKLDAYPVYEWGTVQGTISQVSLTPDEKGMFTIQIQLTDYQRLANKVRIGMQGQGNIVFADRTLADYTFRKFRKVTTELTQ